MFHLFLSLSPPIPYQEAYTRVLIGNIDLSRLIFPAGTSGRFQRPGWTLISLDSDHHPGKVTAGKGLYHHPYVVWIRKPSLERESDLPKVTQRVTRRARL